MYSIWWTLVPFLVVLLIVFAIIRYRIHIGRLVLKEEEKLLAGQFELLQKEQEEMNDIKVQMAGEIRLWKQSRQERSERIELFQNDLLSDMEMEEERCYWQDALLNLTFLHKLDECRSRDIEVVLEGFPREGMPAPNAGYMELSSLMINLFDNAREACQLIPEQEDRRIVIAVRRNGGKLFVSMDNSCNEQSRQRGGAKTWKKDAGKHGIGLDIINDLVDSMNGRIKSERQENVYHVELMLPAGRGA
ncbi:MAG: GHKL domain-containing protein [Eubacterium sp.]|nr:GHKL domain-containing protein [Eubacterium sp.]